MAFREKTVQCLIRAQYGRGGPFIMETLLHYFMMENYLRRDSNTGLWLLLGSIVQIGMSKHILHCTLFHRTLDFESQNPETYELTPWK